MRFVGGGERKSGEDEKDSEGPKSSKGPQNLLKLGITLSELGEKDQGCTMLNGIQQQYPNASKSVIQKAKYEKKKFKCQKAG